MTLRAVIFDLGGVVVGSPLRAIAEYERELGLPSGFVARLVLSTGPAGAWSRLERGELALDAFYPLFDREALEAGETLSSRAMMGRIRTAAQPRPRMLAAIRRIRERGLRTSALTNNWVGDEGPSSADQLVEHFDVVVESSAVGLRKPDPRIYELACRQLAIAPREAVFLDDIGGNLKPARALGMTTIRVDDPEEALVELSRVLGFSVLDDPT